MNFASTTSLHKQAYQVISWTLDQIYRQPIHALLLKELYSIRHNIHKIWEQSIYSENSSSISELRYLLQLDTPTTLAKQSSTYLPDQALPYLPPPPPTATMWTPNDGIRASAVLSLLLTVMLAVGYFVPNFLDTPTSPFRFRGMFKCSLFCVDLFLVILTNRIHLHIGHKTKPQAQLQNQLTLSSPRTKPKTHQPSSYSRIVSRVSLQLSVL